MSDISPQLALLLPPGQLASLTSARAPGGAAPVAADFAALLGKPLTAGLQQQLAPVSPVSPIGDLPAEVLADAATDAAPEGAALNFAQQAFPPPPVLPSNSLPTSDGKLLPSGGKLLPPDSFLLPPPLAPNSSDLSAKSAVQTNNAQLSLPPLDVSSEPPGQMVASAKFVPAENLQQLLEQVETAANDRSKVLTLAESGQARAQSAIQAASLPSAAVEGQRMAWPLLLAGAGIKPVAEGTTTAATAADSAIAALLDAAGEGGIDITRVRPLTDSAATQLNMHARPATEMMFQSPATTAGASGFPSLDTLASLRPQAGDNSNNWAGGLGQRLLLMAEKGIETARMRLSPANLGMLDIQISIDEEGAQVRFGAQHGATRDALESALPRLREMFAEQGMQLTHADVYDQGKGSQQGFTTKSTVPDSPGSANGGIDASTDQPAHAAVTKQSARALDVYA